MPPQQYRGRRALLPLAIALLAGCAETTHKDIPPPWYAGASEPYYEQLRYWPEDDAGADNGTQCVPLSQIEVPDDAYSPAESVDDVWSRVRDGFAIEGDVDEHRVDRQMRLYADRQRFFDALNSNASWYLRYVVGELEERDMPLELALLPIVESAYNPGATSRSQAAGIWQMVPGTARHLGLQQNGWYDGRRDVVASTEAALDYLTDLHKRFDGDWYLALAAYNTGEGNVERAIARNRRLGRPTDYWSLPLSQQACNYVPRLLALSRVLQDPEDHGVELAPIPNTPAFEPVQVNEQIDLRAAASRAGMDTGELLSLNRALRHGRTAPNTTTTLLVPSDDKDDFLAALEDLPAAQPALAEGYRVRPGDTLASIARLHQTTPEALRAANDMRGDRLIAGETLRLPGEAVLPPREYPTTASVELKNRGVYVVRPGDSLWRISSRVGVSAAQLAALNGITLTTTLQPGQSLRVRGDEAQASTPRVATVAGRRRIDYTVQSGDTLSRIASRFKVALPALLRWNGISAEQALIHPGQSLVLYIDPSLAVTGSS